MVSPGQGQSGFEVWLKHSLWRDPGIIQGNRQVQNPWSGCQSERDQINTNTSGRTVSLWCRHTPLTGYKDMGRCGFRPARECGRWEDYQCCVHHRGRGLWRSLKGNLNLWGHENQRVVDYGDTPGNCGYRIGASWIRGLYGRYKQIAIDRFFQGVERDGIAARRQRFC